ncbi:MAG TPA: LysR family transcriptional regulator [Chthoniobacteraceae bacterium]|nr:LysR family transcriptional regulator [Chthoniobacteraceae bacterium]
MRLADRYQPDFIRGTPCARRSLGDGFANTGETLRDVGHRIECGFDSVEYGSHRGGQAFRRLAPDMYIDHFKVFCDLAETQSFSKAAALNRVSQSAVSQRVRQLEEKFGSVLIERGRRNFALTPEGLAMLEAAREIMAIYSNLGTRLNTIRNEVTGELRVASIFSIGLHELPPLLKSFRARHPDVHVQVEFRRSQQVYHEVLNGNVDLGLVAYPAKRTGIGFDVFEEDDMVLIVHPNHALAKSTSVPLSKLSAEKFISFEPDTPTRKVIDRFLRENSVDPVHVMEFDNIETVKRAVEVESGVSIVPENTVRQEVESGLLAAIHLEAPRLTRPLGVIYQRNRARFPAMAEFMSVLKNGASRVTTIANSEPTSAG